MFYKRLKKDIISDTIIHILLILMAGSMIYPFYYLAINSFNAMLAHGPVYILPVEFTFANYRTVFKNTELINSFFMTFLRTGVGTMATVFITAMCAYALRKQSLSMRNIYLILFTIPMFFSGGIVPIYLNFRMLNLIDNFLVYIVPQIFSFFFVIIFMSNFNAIPDSLEESAKIDGAKDFRIFIKIYLPISIPVIATLSLYAGVQQWNSWFDTLFYTTNPKLMTLSAMLMKIVRQNNQSEFAEMLRDRAAGEINPEGVKFATMLISILPITLLYPFLQKYFIKGIMIGAIKG